MRRSRERLDLGAHGPLPPAFAANAQNVIRPDNWRLRLSPTVEVMRPTVGEPIAESGKPK